MTISMQQYYSLPEVAARFGVQPITVRRWVKQGSFPVPIRHRRRRYFLIEEVRAWESKRSAA